MRKFRTVIQPTPDTHDADDVRWVAPNGSEQGFGYRSKKTGLIHVKHCPACQNENYMSQPACIRCGFNPNPDVEETIEKLVFGGGA